MNVADNETRRRLRTMVATAGVSDVAEIVGICRKTLSRVIAGRRCHRSTVKAARLAILVADDGAE